MSVSEPPSPASSLEPPASTAAAAAIAADIRERGPITVARFMEIALYDREAGYYARAAQRSGRAGDFFTSVDVGPLFGELLAAQFAEMLDIVSATNHPVTNHPITNPESLIPSLVEAAAGNGRLSADVLRALAASRPGLLNRLQLHLVEMSAPAREAQRATLGEFAHLLVSSGPDLPDAFDGVLFANELLDAMPVHQVVMGESGLREMFVQVHGGPERPALQMIEAEPSTPALAAYLESAGVTLDAGTRAEISLAAMDWTRRAARALRRGFIVLIDYGHDARDLYSSAHATGTLTTYSRHTTPAADVPDAWLDRPGEQDITAHVDFSSVRAAAESEGCTALGLVDQTYFLMNLVDPRAFDDDRRRRALKTLIMPGGLGSTMKVLVLAKGVGRPALSALARGRLT